MLEAIADFFARIALFFWNRHEEKIDENVQNDVSAMSDDGVSKRLRDWTR